MDNENDLNFDLDKIEVQTEEKLKVKNRFEKLSEKVILSNKELEAERLKLKAKEDEALTLSRERDFYKQFAATSGKYPNASQYQDKIWEKVKSGYDVEDAVVTILNKEGKLTNAGTQGNSGSSGSQSYQHKGEVVGGSSSNFSEGEKPVERMSRDEMLKALLEEERKGNISMS